MIRCCTGVYRPLGGREIDQVVDPLTPDVLPGEPEEFRLRLLRTAHTAGCSTSTPAPTGTSVRVASDGSGLVSRVLPEHGTKLLEPGVGGLSWRPCCSPGLSSPEPDARCSFQLDVAHPLRHSIRAGPCPKGEIADLPRVHAHGAQRIPHLEQGLGGDNAQEQTSHADNYSRHG